MADQLDRRRSTASQRTLHESHDDGVEDFDMFGNDFAVDGGTAAGRYQPASISRNAGSSSTSPPRNPTRRSIALQTNSNSSSSDSPKKRQLPLSDGVPRALSRNSFSLRHDAQYSDASRRIPSVSSTSGMTEISSARPLSTASRLSMHRPQSSYVGASAPSHPYGMYPQNTSLNRQSTVSSQQPPSSRSLSGPQRPTHPYGMYPQSTDDAAETDPLHSSADIASVGFLGLNQPYARRLGPDGEEADDLIGPDGHAEQLPPYTQYPDGREAGPLPTKQRLLPSAAPAGSRMSHVSTDIPQTANSATSMSDSLLAHPAPVDGAENPFSDPSEPRDRSRREKLTDKSKKRTCFGRLPVWAVILMLTLLVIVAATIGALIGRLLPHGPRGNGNHDNNPNSNPMGVTAPPMYTTTFHDAAPLQTTASNIPPAPTGPYSLFLGTPSEISSSCLDTNQAPAWQCANQGAFLNMEVSNPMWDAAQISITTNSSKSSHGFPFGARPPTFNGTATASLMNDTNDPELGPALFFVQTFNKVVILPYTGNNINGTGSTPSGGPAAAAPSGAATPPGKRSSTSLSTKMSRLLGRGDLDGGDDESLLAWVCFWNNTTLEGFIYVEQNASVSSNDTAAANSVATTAGPQATPTTHSKRDSDGGNEGSDGDSKNDGESSDDGNSGSHNNGGKNGNGGKNWNSGNDNNNNAGSGGGDGGHGHSHHHFSNENKGTNGSWPPNIPLSYPRIIKLQERRDPTGGQPAYCQVMQVNSDYSFYPAPGDNPPVNLNETDDGSVNQRVVYAPTRRDLSSRQNVADFCHCEWLSQ